ncbi:MAG: UbiD family decarboxylase [Nitrososphaerota archaeon]|nr:UbiD family decarboxylase [Nitrososphaerota archaeon]
MREFLSELDSTGDLAHVRREVSIMHEIAAVESRLDGRPVLFENVREARDYRVVAGLCGTRTMLSRALGVDSAQLLAKTLGAIENPKPVKVVDTAPCQEVAENGVDLRRIPILRHYENDGGSYITAAILVIKDQELGYNASYHRLMVIGKDRVAVRILPRHLDEFVRRGNRRVGIAIGNHPAFLFASAVSCELGKSELAIANSLKETRFVKCGSNDALVPAGTELVLEGEITDELVDEGPFPDIIGSYDIVRKQRVIRVSRVTHRSRPIYQSILPGGVEHRFLMGTPREATMFREISKVCECLDVRLTPGGSSWLHAVVRIRKRKNEDARNALEAAFRGHPSLKHAVVVDEDIDLDGPDAAEWAIATRAQLDSDLMLKPGEYGSSLDPSADQVTRKTCKAGLDATIPTGAPRGAFLKSRIPMADKLSVEDYLE